MVRFWSGSFLHVSSGDSQSRSQAPFPVTGSLGAVPGLAGSSAQVSGFGSTPSLPSASSLAPFESELVAVFADLVVLLGLPKSMGEIYGFIFASAEPPTFADIEHKLGLSKGSVSQGLRALRELGAVREADRQNDGASEDRAMEPGIQRVGQKATVEEGRKAEPARATRWVATTELRQLIGTLLRERLTPYLERQDHRMQNAETALKDASVLLPAKNYKALKSRLEKLQTWQSRARAVLPVLGKML